MHGRPTRCVFCGTRVFTRLLIPVETASFLIEGNTLDCDVGFEGVRFDLEHHLMVLADQVVVVFVKIAWNITVVDIAWHVVVVFVVCHCCCHLFRCCVPCCTC